jgi:hypothetical protein
LLYILLAFIGLAAVAVYVLVVFTEVPGAVSERWGELEGLPDNLGEWTADRQSSAGLAALERGLVREVRTWREPGAGWFGRDRLVLQTRHREQASGDIQSVEPDVPLRRRRIKRSAHSARH